MLHYRFLGGDRMKLSLFGPRKKKSEISSLIKPLMSPRSSAEVNNAFSLLNPINPHFEFKLEVSSKNSLDQNRASLLKDLPLVHFQGILSFLELQDWSVLLQTSAGKRQFKSWMTNEDVKELSLLYLAKDSKNYWEKRLNDISDIDRRCYVRIAYLNKGLAIGCYVIPLGIFFAIFYCGYRLPKWLQVLKIIMKRQQVYTT